MNAAGKKCQLILVADEPPKFDRLGRRVVPNHAWWQGPRLGRQEPCGGGRRVIRKPIPDQ